MSARVALMLVTLCATVGFAHADATEDALRQLRKAVMSQRDGSHLPLLFSLRQLRDPALKPMFYELVQSEEWPLQVHAVLGLAECDDSHLIDPWLITKVSPLAQEAIIANAIDLKLIDAPRMKDLLTWDKLEPTSRLLLLAELQSSGSPADAATVEPLAASEMPNVAGMAAALLEELGSKGRLASFSQQMAGKAPELRDQAILYVVEGVRMYKFRSAIEWVVSVVEDESIDDAVRHRGIFTLLELDAQRGIEQWNRAFDRTASYGRRARLALLALAARPCLPATVFDRFPADQELTAAMAEVGRAFAAGSDPSPAIIKLLEQGHGPSAEWITSLLPSLPAEHSTPVYSHLLDDVEPSADAPILQRRSEGERVALAVQAAGRLYDQDARAVLERLARAADDSLTQQAILLGLFECRSSAIAQAVASLKRGERTRSDALALLLEARHTQRLTPEQIQQLALIASGGGRVSDVLQIQAAWLYLKHTGQTEKALASMALPGLPGGRTTGASPTAPTTP